MFAETISSMNFTNVAKKEAEVPFICLPTMSTDRHCLFQVTLGSVGAEHITLFPASSAEAGTVPTANSAICQQNIQAGKMHTHQKMR